MVIPPSPNAAATPEVDIRRLKVPDAPLDLSGPPRSPVVPRPKSRAELALESTKLENLHARLTLPATQGGEGTSAAPEVNAPVGRPRSGDLATPGVIALSANPAAPTPVMRLPDTNLRARFAVGPNAGAGSPGGVPGGVPGGRGGSGGGPGGSGGGPGGGGLSAPDIYVEPAGPVPPGPVIVGRQPSPLAPAPPPPPEPAAPQSPAGSRNPNRGEDAQPEAQENPESQKSAEQRARELLAAVRAGPRSARPVQTTYAFIPNLTSQSSTWMVRYAEQVHGSNDTNGANGPARVAREGGVRIPGITPPRVVKKADPCYPANPLAERVNGTVILYGVIRADGIVEDVVLVEGFHPRIDQKAISSFAQSFFEPARKRDRPVSVEVLLEIPFNMVPCL
jgi:outer membrane biosynthesis protein TonB